ncbi:MAG: hypothetical protein KBT12_06575 [Bacteroidales bacterium]|nr:hypothetical protein [Candidatus Physcousia equi]
MSDHNVFSQAVRQCIHHALQLAALACLLLLLAACSSKKEQPATPQMRRTVIVYMVADNNLEYFASADINEMRSAAKTIPAGCQLILYVDDTKAPRIIEFNAQQGMVEHERMEECNSASPSVMRQQLQSIIHQYPSEHYALVLWSHGSGWIPPAPSASAKSSPRQAPRRSIFIDNSWQKGDEDSDEMSIPDLRAVLEQLSVKHWDYILFDACHMQCVESDYELRHLTDYIIASPAEIPATGAPYHAIMPALMQDDNAAFAIAQTYHDAATEPAMLSVVRTDQLEALLQTTRRLIPDLYDRTSTLATHTIQAYGPLAKASRWRPEYHDMASALNTMLDSEAFSQWRTEMEKAVVLALPTPKWNTAFGMTGFVPVITDPDHLALVSIFLPHPKYDEHSSYNEDIRQTEWYQAYHN